MKLKDGRNFYIQDIDNYNIEFLKEVLIELYEYKDTNCPYWKDGCDYKKRGLFERDKLIHENGNKRA